MDDTTYPNPYTATHFNTDGDTIVYSAAEAEALFQSADPTNCPIYDYELQETTAPITDISETYTFLMIEGRTTNIV